MNVSYFEIGGELVECHHSTSIPSSSYSASSFRGAPTTSTVAQVQAQRNGKVAGGRKADRYSEKQAVEGAQKVLGGRRVLTRGLTIAATLAVADGPLPIGDVLAAGVLIGVGGYLLYSGTKDVIQ